MIDKNDIDELLEKWYEAKEQIAILEKSCEKYKKYCEKIMDKTDKNSLTSDAYSLKRVFSSRTSMSKKNVPDSIWDKYATKSTFSVCYLRPKKKSK